MNIHAIKRSHLQQLAAYREELRRNPRLTYLFFELTDRCNLECLHCGSRCERGNAEFLAPEDVSRVLDDVANAYGTQSVMICITGGEPMLHPSFFPIVQAIADRGFPWGMTTNGMCINAETAQTLRRAKMSTVSVSLDGLEASHDWLRRHPGAYRGALRGIDALITEGFDVQVTTVVHHRNLPELDGLYAELLTHGVRSWRIINMEPIGRALDYPDLNLSAAELSQMLAYIRARRFDAACPMEVTYGCSHYLGPELERMVRDYYFLCGCGTMVAGICANGDICGCLDVPRRPELVQGNIHRDRFTEIWENRFQPYRADRTHLCAQCAACADRELCGGDSLHTWDFDRSRPLLCYPAMCAQMHNP